MVDSLRGDDVSPQSPKEAFDPFQPLASQIRQLESFLNLAFEDYGDLVSKIASRVLEMPPEERFTKSIHEIEELLEEELGSAEVFRSKFPLDDDQLISLLHDAFDQLVEKVLSDVFVIRNPEDHLLLASAMQELRVSIDLSHRCMYDDEFAEQVNVEQLVSSLSAIWARIYSIVDEEKSEIRDEIAHDIVRSFYHRTGAFGTPQLTVHPEEMNTADAFQFVRNYGAVIAYASLDISVSRGAEVANLSPNEFEPILQKHGVSVRNGPESVEELNQDSMLHEQ